MSPVVQPQTIQSEEKKNIFYIKMQVEKYMVTVKQKCITYNHYSMRPHFIRTFRQIVGVHMEKC